MSWHFQDLESAALFIYVSIIGRSVRVSVVM